MTRKLASVALLPSIRYSRHAQVWFPYRSERTRIGVPGTGLLEFQGYIDRYLLSSQSEVENNQGKSPIHQQINRIHSHQRCHRIAAFDLQYPRVDAQMRGIVVQHQHGRYRTQPSAIPNSHPDTQVETRIPEHTNHRTARGRCTQNSRGLPIFGLPLPAATGNAPPKAQKQGGLGFK